MRFNYLTKSYKIVNILLFALLITENIYPSTNQNNTKQSHQSIKEVRLEKNMVKTVNKSGKAVDKNILTSEMLSSSNTKYIIQYDYDLNEKEIIIPNNCILEFQGGSLSNGTLTGKETSIKAGLVILFKENLVINGSWNIEGGFPQWFGAVVDGISDDTSSIQRCVNSFRNTILRGNSFKISSVFVEPISNPYGRTIINESIIKTTGEGISLNEHCSFKGGQIVVGENATGITIGRLDNRESHNRINVLDVTIISGSKTNTYGIKCIASVGIHYNAFCNINNVRIYGCLHGFYGNIRSSYINISLEGCADNFTGTNCSFNNINITGNASKAYGYDYFISINGSYNYVNAQIYDIGNPGLQKQLIEFNGHHNTVNGNSYPIYNTDVSNTSSKPYYLDGILRLDNPEYEVIFHNVKENDKIKKDFFNRHNRLYTHINLYPINKSLESYIEFRFGKVFGFSALHILHSFGNVSFTKVEIRRDASDKEPFISTTNKGESSSISAYSVNYNDYWFYDDSYNGQWNTNLSIRCYLTGRDEVRAICGELHAQMASSVNNAGAFSDVPTRVQNGDTYFATDIRSKSQSKGVLAVYKDGKWYDSDGIEIKKSYTGFSKSREICRRTKEKGTSIYHFFEAEFKVGNPMQLYIPLNGYQANNGTEFIFGGLICISGNPNSTYNINFTSHYCNYPITLYTYHKITSTKLHLILGINLIAGYDIFMDIPNIISKEDIIKANSLSRNIDISSYISKSFLTIPKATDSTTRKLYNNAKKGESIYDITLKKPVWWTGTSWVDATGRIVE